jgi:hypothetical protein
MSTVSSTAIRGLGRLRIADLQDVGVEYARVEAISRMFAVSRPFIFEAINKGVKSLHIKKPGAKKGIRLIHVQSMREFLEGFGEV